ncbi:hypothetical protein D3C78_470100 [compost metagenome]
MNNKRWSFIAIILIALGVAGMAYQQFDFSNNEEFPYHQQKWSFDSLTSLSVESDYNVDVKFIKSTDNSNYVEVSGNMKQDTIDQLKNTVADGDSFTLNLLEKQSWSFFSVNFQSTKQHITVALSKPEELDQLKFKLTSEDGSFTDLVGKTIELSTSSGSLAVNNVTTNQLTLNATSGNITAKKIKGDTEINLTSGNTKVDELNGALVVESTSGEISINHVNGPVKTSITSGNTKINNLTGPGEFKSTSGNITLSDQRSDSLDISSQSGNVKLSMDDSFKGIYDLKTTSGNIKAPESPMENTDLIKVRATSGNIRIE